VAAFAIFSVVSHWNDLYWPFVVVASPEMMTPPQGVAFFRMAGDSGGNVGALMAASVVVTTPMIIAFLSAQRQFMSGLSLAGQH
jgi:multiple sugar transport system permease protein